MEVLYTHESGDLAGYTISAWKIHIKPYTCKNQFHFYFIANCFIFQEALLNLQCLFSCQFAEKREQYSYTSCRNYVQKKNP
jgi:hypothetical protein